MKTPVNRALAQSDIDFANYKALNADLSAYSGLRMSWNTSTKKFDVEYNPTGDLLVSVNVQDPPYNATGDGVTDDTAAIQAAINDVSAGGGGVVFLPSGNYLCNGTFDATTNSILKIPFVDPAVSPLPTVELRGLASQQWGVYSTQTLGTFISSNKTGTGVAPSLLAAAQYFGPSMNGTRVVIRNIQFQLNGNPTINCLRMERCGSFIIEDCVIVTVPTSEPTNNTTGLWMANLQNLGVQWAARTLIGGFGVGMRTGEHLRAHWIYIALCSTGLLLEEAYHLTKGNFIFDRCPCNIRFNGANTVELDIDTERHFEGWFAPPQGGEVVDGSNLGEGIIRYHPILTEVGRTRDAIGVTGGNRLKFVRLGNVNPVRSLDDFRESVLNASRWDTNYFGVASSGITVSQINQRLEIALTGAATGINGITGVSAFNFTGKSFNAKVWQVATSSANDTYVTVGSADNSCARWMHENGTLYAQYRNAGAPVNVGSLSYNSTWHLWWRIMEDRGIIYWDTSQDGQNWVNRFNTDTGLPSFTSVKVAIGAGNNSAGSDSMAIFNEVTIA